MTLAKLVAAWNDFFFKPVSPLPYAVFRILYGFLMLQLLFIQLLPDFEFWYGEQAIISVNAVTKYFWHHPIFDFMALTGNDPTGLHIFFAVTAISLRRQKCQGKNCVQNNEEGDNDLEKTFFRKLAPRCSLAHSLGNSFNTAKYI
jgi:hypothetical protein